MAAVIRRNTYMVPDGGRMGVTIEAGDESKVNDPGISCTEDEARMLWVTLRDVFHGKPKAVKTPEMIAVLEPGEYCGWRIRSSIEIAIRQHRTRGTWFLNVRGNYIAVMTGQNAFGDMTAAADQNAQMFLSVLDLIERANVGFDAKRLRGVVRNMDIYIHDLAFAGYTTQVTYELGVRKLIRHLYARYSTWLVMDGVGETSLLQMLNLRRTDGEQFDDSLTLDILNGGKKLMHLCAYNKAEQMAAAGKNMLAVKKIDLESRLRLDLTVDSRYFQTMWGIPRDKMTLRSLKEYVQKRWDGDWRKAFMDLMGYALRRTCLFYMFEDWPNVFGEEHDSMCRKWELEYAKGRAANNSFSADLKAWAAAQHIDLRVSPSAHLCMMLGEIHAEVNKESTVKGIFINAKQRAAYLNRFNQSSVRRMTRVRRIVRQLSVETSAPEYEEPSIVFRSENV